jgi:predicted DNA binding protein
MLKRVSLEVDSPNDLQRVAVENNARLSVIDCRDVDTTGMSMLLDIRGTKESVKRTIEGLRRLRGTKNVYAAEASGGKALCVAVLAKPALCAVSHGTNVICLGCPYNSTETHARWDILVRSSADLQNLLRELKNRGVDATIRDVSDARRDDVLTERQREVLGKAIALGFFEFPRRIDLTELSRVVGIKPSTLSQILRSAERKIMADVGGELGVRQPRHRED